MEGSPPLYAVVRVDREPDDVLVPAEVSANLESCDSLEAVADAVVELVEPDEVEHLRISEESR